MDPGAVLQEEYRRCLERDFRRGHAGVCADSSLKQMLWRQLLEDPELHGPLQGEDTFTMIAGALQGQLDLGVALQNLHRAFEVLELAAVNLYFFPWRKEFSTIKTFSGVYVHVLQGVLSEADIVRSFHRMGYVQRDNLHLVIAQLPPGAGLLRVANSFFAARVECEILGKIVEAVGACGVSAEELLQARREARGGLEGCVAKLQSLLRWPRGQDFCTEPADGVDLYREGPEGLNPYGEPPGSRLPPPHQPAPYERSSSSSPRLRSKDLHARSPQGLSEGRSKLWGSGPEQPYGNGLVAPEGPDPETSFSFISLRRELSRSSDPDSPAQPGSRFLAPSPHYDGPGSPASPSARQPRSPQLSPVGLRRAQGLGSGAAGPEPPRYHLHACLLPGALPSSCCGTCRLLHASGCDVAQHCRSAHHVEELQSEKQQRLWLQRTEVDKLL